MLGDIPLSILILKDVAVPSRMGQVCRNLLENASAACRDPVEIVIRCERSELDGHTPLRVSANVNGSRVSPEERPRMLEAFDTTRTKGTGVAIFRRIIEAHAGRIVLGEPSGLSPGSRRGLC